MISTHLSICGDLNGEDHRSGVWSFLWLRFHTLTLSLVAQTGIKCHDAEDVASEVWLKIFPHLDKFLAKYNYSADRPPQFGPWLTTIAHRAVIDFLRHSQHHPATLIGDPVAAEHDQDRVLAFNESSIADERLQHAMEQTRQRVHPQSWNAFLQHTVDGRTHSAIAEDLSLTVNATKAAVRRVRRMIAKFYTDQDCRGAAA